MKKKKKRSAGAEAIRESLCAIMEREFPVTGEDGEAAVGEDGGQLFQTGAEMQSEALFRRALRDTKSFEVLRSMISDGGDGEEQAVSLEEAERLIREAIRGTKEMKE